MKRIFFITLLWFAFISCSSKKCEDNNSVICSATSIDNEKYMNFESDSYSIINIGMSNDCLRISIQYSGGCEEVSAKLVDSGDIIETDPIQRNLRLLFTESDDCEALIKKDFYFVIENLKVENSNKVLLSFQNTDLTFLYEY